MLFIALTGLVLCKQYGIDGEQLAVLWLTFASTHGYDTVTLEGLEHLDRVEQNSSRKKAAAEAANAATLNRLNGKDSTKKCFISYYENCKS